MLKKIEEKSSKVTIDTNLQLNQLNLNLLIDKDYEEWLDEVEPKLPLMEEAWTELNLYNSSMKD